MDLTFYGQKFSQRPAAAIGVNNIDVEFSVIQNLRENYTCATCGPKGAVGLILKDHP